MGMYPRQEFVYGIGITEEIDVESFLDWCEEAKHALSEMDIEKINAFLKTNQRPQMYTISTQQ